MLSQIAVAFADEGINIENMLNKSKKDFAYTILDINGEIKPSIAERICKIEGIIKVRAITKA
jgi:D-3-phosphoglycerate dehydrogenase